MCARSRVAAAKMIRLTYDIGLPVDYHHRREDYFTFLTLFLRATDFSFLNQHEIEL